MNFILLAVLVIALWGSRYRKSDFGEYLSVEQTYAVNGIFVIFVFLRHFGMTITYNSYDGIFAKLDEMTGNLIVTTFLFYSGYGIMYSLINKNGYLKKIPIRFLRLLFQFDIAILCYLAIACIMGKEYPYSTVLLSFVAWETIGNSTWYIFAILCLYIITFCFGLICKDKRLMHVLLVFLGCIIYIFAIRKAGKDRWWYDTILCFPVGMLYSLYSEKINNFLGAKVIRRIMFFVIMLLGFAALYYVERHAPNALTKIVLREMRNVSFALLIVSITTIFKIGNRVLSFLGNYIFEIFILQRIPMIIFENIITNSYVYFAVCFVITILLSIAFKAVVSFLLDHIFKSKKKATA